MQVLDAIQFGPHAWGLIALAALFSFVVFACSVFSLQMCMAYFGDEIPSYLGCAGLKLKMIVAVASTMLVGYAFLGPFYILAVPVAFVVALTMVANAAKCDRFFASIIALLHASFSAVAAGLCGLVFWIGLSAFGYDAAMIASEFEYASRGSSSCDGFSSGVKVHSRSHRRNALHPNPYITTTVHPKER